MNWRDISYLRQGTAKQQAAAYAIDAAGVLADLAPFDPVVVSTICIGIDSDHSDIDIICHITDPVEFQSRLQNQFAELDGYQCRKADEVVIASFHAHEFEFEIYGSPVPTEKQNAYRHLSMMFRILERASPKLQEDVRKLKQAGYKSEAAFCECLKLEGDPFQSILELEQVSDLRLGDLIDRAGYAR